MLKPAGFTDLSFFRPMFLYRTSVRKCNWCNQGKCEVITRLIYAHYFRMHVQFSFFHISGKHSNIMHHFEEKRVVITSNQTFKILQSNVWLTDAILTISISDTQVMFLGISSKKVTKLLIYDSMPLQCRHFKNKTTFTMNINLAGD